MGRMKPRKQFEVMGTISLWVQNLKQALRNLRSHGWQAGISATGLAVGHRVPDVQPELAVDGNELRLLSSGLQGLVSGAA